MNSSIPFYQTRLLDPIGSYIGTDVCTHNPDNTNNCERAAEEARNSMVLLLQQDGFVLLNMCQLELQYFYL
jgi:hypothetical protein